MQKPKLSLSTTSHVTNPPLAKFAYFAFLLDFPCFLPLFSWFVLFLGSFLCSFLCPFPPAFLPSCIHFIPSFIRFVPSFIRFIPSSMRFFPSLIPVSLPFPAFLSLFSYLSRCGIYLCSLAYFTFPLLLPLLLLACCLYFCLPATFTSARLLPLLLIACFG